MMGDTNNEDILLLLLARHRAKRNKMEQRKKRFWVRHIYTERKRKGEFHQLVMDMKLCDHELFYKQFRMSPGKMEELLGWVAPKIMKDSSKREAVGAEERLCVTLRYLATGDAQCTIAASYRMSPTTVGRIVAETTIAIWETLSEHGFLKCQTTKEEWLLISEAFEAKWNFPHCVRCCRWQACPNSSTCQ